MVLATKWEEIYKIFWDKIEKDKGFFMYNNVSPELALEIAKERSKALLLEAITRLTLSCTPDVDFFDFDTELEQFNFDCTHNEIRLLASIMRELFFDRDKSLLKAFEVRFTPSDLNIFSPANERKTFMEMCEEIVKTNNKDIDNYASRNRKTGKLKIIDYAKYSGQ